MSTEQAFQAQALHQDTLLDKQNVVGVAVGYKNATGENTGDVAVVVLVEQKKPLAALTAQDVIPKELEGMKTDVVEVGYLRAQQTARDRYRPVIPAGVTIGHYKVTAGTLGAVVKDRTTGATLLLSNNHVLANSNDALIGDDILQPAAMDGGHLPADVVAKLERFVKLRYTDETTTPPPVVTPPPTPPPTNPPTTNTGCDIVSLVVTVANALAALLGSSQRVTTTTLSAGSQTAGGIAVPAPVTGTALAVPENRLDAALARPLDASMFSSNIQTIGVVSGTKEPVLGMRVRKFGRTTEYTEGNITLINATVNIAYNTAAGAKTARFVGQTITEAMSQGGDSGSLIVDATENKAVGLLFAGSTLATIFTPITVVLSELNIVI
ncbi:MAG: hypothetical protein IPK17_07755 [Chloroflexi bacterium]|uniref:hypothetical protein n=1 Tax=Candidatus Flexifilum breve TaxID=3140694 RepID=UPI003135D647|nr:hypothetical protein [Chloroflexota bacterium]